MGAGATVDGRATATTTGALVVAAGGRAFAAVDAAGVETAGPGAATLAPTAAAALDGAAATLGDEALPAAPPATFTGCPGTGVGFGAAGFSPMATATAMPTAVRVPRVAATTRRRRGEGCWDGRLEVRRIDDGGSNRDLELLP